MTTSNDNKRRGMPTPKVIRDHWAQWLVEQGKFDSVEEVWAIHIFTDEVNGEIVIRDEGLCCFACGFTSQRAPLERAHILAIFDGGSNDADNLHMLCKLCHKASEFISGEEYFAWFSQRNIMHRALEAAIRNQTGGATKLTELWQMIGVK